MSIKALCRPRIVLLIAALAAFTACNGDNAFPLTPATPEPDLETALTRAIQKEYRVETIYLRVLSDFGAVQPFENIMYGEPRHSKALADLFTARDLAVPTSTWTLDNVPTYPAIPNACAAALAEERDDIDMYDDLLKLDLPEDVLQVLSENRASSAEQRVPAFEACG